MTTSIKLFISFLITSMLLFLFASNSFAFENLVYTVRGFPAQISDGTKAIEDFKLHANKIHILSSQAYYVTESGIVYGEMNPQMQALAKVNHTKLMPLVGNTNFDRKKVHQFLDDEEAQERAILSILQICKENQYYGIQVDFEGMSFTKKDLFTKFYKKLADTLHKNNFKISIAIVPKLTDENPKNAYLTGKYAGWTGVYDYKALSQNSDFVTIMAYDEHGVVTTPGPTAAYSWDEAIIKLALKDIPAEKLSLGIPWYSFYWYTTKPIDKPLKSTAVEVNYQDALRILNDHSATLNWNNIDKIHYAMFMSHFLYSYLFVEDVDSFAAKINLVKKYHLRGISNWYLGAEDPRVWSLLKEK